MDEEPRLRVAGTFFMGKRIQYQRLVWLALLLCLAFAGLGYRLVDLQVLRHEELSAKALQNTQRELLMEPRRGDILDSQGNLLATSIFMKQVCADPTLVGTNQVELARVLAPLLQTNENRLVQLLTPTLHRITNGTGPTNVYYRYVRLSKRVPVEAWIKIRAAMTNLVVGPDQKLLSPEQRAGKIFKENPIFAENEQVRTYPSRSLAAHILGYTAVEEKEVDDQKVYDIVGKDGIERSFNSKLTGVRGWRLTEQDRRKREVVAFREQDVEAKDGYNVVLTIDSVIQHIVETALAEAMEKHSPISASGIVVRPRTGEILAMATLPNYDPNNVSHTPVDLLLNRVISEMSEPGSTFKIVVVSGGLNDGLVRLTDTFDCEHGQWYYAGRRLRDHEPYDTLSVEQIITKSSNIGAAKIGLKMGENRLYEYIRNYGFGQNTGIPLPAEIPGWVHPVKNWTKVSIAQIPMGQGITVTRLQMMMAMCAIANKGWLMRPMLVDRLEDNDHKLVTQFPPQRVRQVISEDACRQMVEALKTVVSPQGTAAKAALDHYTVAGKTGTAQKVENKTYVNKYFSSFIGFFPADNPELCISVTLDEPKEGHYGGLVAAPYFKAIAESAASYLNIRPETDDSLQRVDPIGAAADLSSV
ncbi:MAG TPA: penicillin-binding protein 2, partial [Patescibacteria group bacterium]|nr:penicillin-binding protein 2 [Patescibacteria group bacterium]